MKKKSVILISVILILAISTSVFANNFFVKQFIADKVDFKIFMDGEEIFFNNSVVTINDTTYLSLRDLCEYMGYNVDWDTENKSILLTNQNNINFEDDVFESREGILANNRKYTFHGQDQGDFSINDYISKMKMSHSYTYNFSIKRKTIEEYAERIQNLMLRDIPCDIAGINIYYDSKSESLLFERKFYQAVTIGGVSVFVVNCNNGEIIKYDNNMY